MQEPVTKLDERFSDPGTSATSWSAAREVLEAAQLSWVSTVRADGRPHVTPLVAVWLDETLYFSTGPTEQKALNIAGGTAHVFAVEPTKVLAFGRQPPSGDGMLETVSFTHRATDRHPGRDPAPRSPQWPLVGDGVAAGTRRHAPPTRPGYYANLGSTVGSARTPPATGYRRAVASTRWAFCSMSLDPTLRLRISASSAYSWAR